MCIEERCGDIAVEGGVGQIIAAMKAFKESSGIQTWGAYALCRILYCNSKCANILEYTYYRLRFINTYWNNKYDIFPLEYCLQAVLKHGVELVIQQRCFHDDEAGMYLTKLESLVVELKLS